MTYSLAMLTKPIAVAETALFIRQAAEVWTEEERVAFIDFIARNPHAGDLVPETGGVRKVRWARQGGGKRGGVRVVYYYHDAEIPLFLLMVYAKNRQENLSAAERKAVRAMTTALKRRDRGRERRAI